MHYVTGLRKPAGPFPVPTASAPTPIAPLITIDALLAPRPHETLEQYALRLRVLHAQLSALLAAVERGARERREREPAPTPVISPRAGAPTRRALVALPPPTERVSSPEPVLLDRRSGVTDRRIGMPDLRDDPYDRRWGLPDRRASSRRPAWSGPRPAPDLESLFWAVQIVAWIIFAFVLLAITQ